MSHPLYWVALQTALGVPCRKFSAILSVFGTPEGVFEATEQELKQSGVLTPKQIKSILAKPYEKAKEIYFDCKQAGIDIYTPEHPLYPNGLRHIEDMPCVLYGKGTLPPLDAKPVIGVVGSRKPTAYGALVARRISRVLGVAGAVVVSGGALGIDSVAHAGAMEAGGTTIGVLGCGILDPYLSSNRNLRKAIEEHGCLLSEYPPREPATRYTFPARNRLIAALSLGIVVVEAGAKSGSLITADFAAEQGKDVFVVPGSVMSPGFAGSNNLVSNGAIPVFGGLDVLKHYEKDFAADLNMKQAKALHETQLKERLVVENGELPHYCYEKNEEVSEKPKEKSEKQPLSHKKIPQDAGKHLSEQALRVYNTILNAKTILLAEIIAAANLPPHVVLRELTGLEVEGLIEKGPAGAYTLRE